MRRLKIVTLWRMLALRVGNTVGADNLFIDQPMANIALDSMVIQENSMSTIRQAGATNHHHSVAAFKLVCDSDEATQKKSTHSPLQLIFECISDSDDNPIPLSRDFEQ